MTDLAFCIDEWDGAWDWNLTLGNELGIEQRNPFCINITDCGAFGDSGIGTDAWSRLAHEYFNIKDCEALNTKLQNISYQLLQLSSNRWV